MKGGSSRIPVSECRQGSPPGELPVGSCSPIAGLFLQPTTSPAAPASLTHRFQPDSLTGLCLSTLFPQLLLGAWRKAHALLQLPHNKGLPGTCLAHLAQFPGHCFSQSPAQLSAGISETYGCVRGPCTFMLKGTFP